MEQKTKKLITSIKKYSIICNNCFNTFFSNNSKQQYCSISCSNKSRFLSKKSSNKSRFLSKKICPKCNTIFYCIPSSKKTWCSKSCAAQVSRAKYKKTKKEKLARQRLERAKRRSRQKQAETETANKQILKLIYQHVPEGYQVDHIIPITKGGLHHENNLQYLPRSENARKGDRLDYVPQNAIRWQDIINIDTQLTEI